MEQQEVHEDGKASEIQARIDSMQDQLNKEKASLMRFVSMDKKANYRIPSHTIDQIKDIITNKTKRYVEINEPKYKTQ